MTVDVYLTVKVLHVISATILFGTGLGTAFFFWSSRNADDGARLFAARTTVRADLFFTLPAVIVQPLSGAWMISRIGLAVTEKWVVASLVLYVAAGACWLPVVGLQLRMMRMLESKISGGPFDAKRFESLRRAWFWLGWPAFISLVIIFYLMVAKPAL